MAGITKFLASSPFLNSMEDHKNSHIVIDGANLQYHLLGKHSTYLSDFYANYSLIKSFFGSFLKRGMTPHVIFSGSYYGDSEKWERATKRRRDRLRGIVALDEEDYSKLLNSTTNLELFKNVVEDLGIEALQAGAEQDFTYEMAAYANHLNGPVLSSSGKLFLMDIPKGFIHFDNAAFDRVMDGRPFKTFFFAKLEEFVDIKFSQNKSALSMWSAILYNKNTFSDFISTFSKNNDHCSFAYKQSNNRWMKDLSGGNFILPQNRILDFLLQKSEHDCRSIIVGCLDYSNRAPANLIFDQMLVTINNKPQNLPSILESSLSKRSEELSIPHYFLKATSFNI